MSSNYTSFSSVAFTLETNVLNMASVTPTATPPPADICDNDGDAPANDVDRYYHILLMH
jgi:hypothetical protein